VSGSVKVTVLVVEDEPQIRRLLRTSLSGQDYRVLEAANGREGLSMAASHQPDLVILDLGLPDMDGLDVIREVRTWGQMPILVLTARGREQDKVQALDTGADDYVTKPFGMGELTARMRVLLRHAATRGLSDPPAVAIGSLAIDLARRTVLLDGNRVALTPHEYAILAVLTRARGKVVTHRQILQEVWGPEFADQTHYVRIYLQRLRAKLETIPARPRYLISEPGVGYRLVDE
jgi:two-component system, OmpR family, KDP operon response regulator KdpE